MTNKEPTVTRMEFRTTPAQRETLVKFAEDNNMNITESLQLVTDLGMGAFEKSKEPNQDSMLTGTPVLKDSQAWVGANFNSLEQVTAPLVEDRETLIKYFQHRMLVAVGHGLDQTKGTRIREIECYLLAHYFTEAEALSWVKWEGVIKEALALSPIDEAGARVGLREQHSLFENVANDIKVGVRHLVSTNVLITNQMVGYK